MKIVQAGQLHRMIGWPNARQAGYIGKFSNTGIGNVSQTITIAVITKMRMSHTAASANFDIATKGGGGNFTIVVNKSGLWA